MEKPVWGQGLQEEGSRHISIFISFSGTFPDLLLVSLLYRVCSGSLVLASCLLTTLAILMVVCGKLSAVSSLLVCSYASHRLALMLTDGTDQKEVSVREKEVTSFFLWRLVISSCCEKYKVYHQKCWRKDSWWKCSCDALSTAVTWGIDTLLPYWVYCKHT